MAIVVKIVPDPNGFRLAEASEVFKGLPEIVGGSEKAVVRKLGRYIPEGTEVMVVHPVEEFIHE